MSQQLKMLLSGEYVADATKRIKNAKHRVYFMSLMLTEADTTSDFITALGDAAERGVSVKLAVDSFTYGELGGHFVPYKYFTKHARNATSFVKRLSSQGVKFNWLGRFSTTPVNGRTHIKFLVVDDTVYAFGGVNLAGPDAEFSDYMFRCENTRLADDLVHEFGQITKADKKGYTYRSHSLSFGDSTVYTDGGFQGDSIIYRRACELSREASKVLLVSQYCPTGKLGRILKSTPSKLYFNPPELANGMWFNKTVIAIGMLFSQHKTIYRRKKYIHSKFMIFTMPDKTKIVLSGSHNFVYGGVLLGTREIALESRDPRVISQIENYFTKHIA